MSEYTSSKSKRLRGNASMQDISLNKTIHSGQLVPLNQTPSNLNKSQHLRTINELRPTTANMLRKAAEVLISGEKAKLGEKLKLPKKQSYKPTPYTHTHTQSVKNINRSPFLMDKDNSYMNRPIIQRNRSFLTKKPQKRQVTDKNPGYTVTMSIDDILRNQYEPKFLPLEIYDPLDDPQTPHTFIKTMQGDSKEVTGQSKWFYGDGDYQWRDVTVVSYDKTDDRYVIRWDFSGKTKKVSRLNLRFTNEDISIHKRRRREATGIRDEAELIMRFHYIVDNMKSIIPKMTVRCTEAILNFVRGNTAKITAANFSDPLVHLKKMKMPTEFLWKSCKSHMLIEDWYTKGYVSAECFRNEYLDSIQPFKLPGYFFPRHCRVTKNEVKVLMAEVDKDYQKSLRISEFTKDIHSNKEKKKTFGALVSKYSKSDADKVQVRDYDYNFLKVLRNVSGRLHQSNSENLHVITKLNTRLLDVRDDYLMPITYTAPISISQLCRSMTSGQNLLIRKLRNLMFDTQYDIQDIINIADEARHKRNHKRIAARAFEGQHIDLEEGLPRDIELRTTKLLKLTNHFFEREMRGILDRTLAYFIGVLETFLDLAQRAAGCEISEEMYLDNILQIYDNLDIQFFKPDWFTLHCTLVFTEVKPKVFKFQLDPMPNDIQESIENIVNEMIEQAKTVECLAVTKLGYARDNRVMKISHAIDQDIIQSQESIKNKLKTLCCIPDRLLAMLANFGIVGMLSAKKLKTRYSQEVKLTDLAKELENINSASTELQMLLGTDDTIYFGFVICHIKETKQNITSKLEDCFNTLITCLIGKYEVAVQNVEKQESEIDDVIGHSPTRLQELAEMKQFLSTQWEDRVGFINKQMENLISFSRLLDIYQIIVEETLYQRYANCFTCIMRLKNMKKACKNDIVTKAEFFAEQLKQNQAEMLDKIDGIRDEVNEMIKEDDIEKFGDVAYNFMGMKRRIEEAIDMSKDINTREGIVGSRLTDYGDLEQLKREFSPYHRIWMFVKDFNQHYPDWMHRKTLQDINRDSLKEEIQKYIMELNTLERTNFKVRESGKALREAFAAKIEAFKPFLPVICDLKNPGMKDRHWEELTARLKIKLTRHLQMTMDDLIAQGIMDHKEVITEISDKASRENILEQGKSKMENEWNDIRFTVIPYRKTNTFVLDDNTDIWELLEEHLMKCISMIGSPYIKFMEREMNYWQSTLQKVEMTIAEWENCQRSWTYLQPILAHKDISSKLPVAARRFNQVNSTWQSIMQAVNVNNQVLEFCTTTNKLLEQLQQNNASLDEILKSLNDYLNSKRDVFPRFFFLANEELLAILSNSQDVRNVQRFMIKCFEGIQNLKFDDKQRILGMISPEQEYIEFMDAIQTWTEEFEEGERTKAIRSVEDWLNDVETEMQRSLKHYMLECWTDGASREKKRTEWLLQWPCQLILAVNNIYWTQNVEDAIIQGGKELARAFKRMDSQLNQIVKLVRNELSEGDRILLGTLVVIEVHNKDIVEHLRDLNVKEPSDFEWMQHMRYYINENTKYLQLKMIDTTRDYGYEYLGNQSRLVITSLTDRCYRTLMCALKLSLGGAPEGPAGTGKTETTKDLAKVVAKKCVVFNCSNNLDHTAMGKFFTGLICCGAWSCFDEFNRIETEVLSVIAEQILTIQMEMVQNKMDRRMRFEGHQVVLDPTCAIFITQNPSYKGRSQLPDNLKALFRPVAMMIPEYSMIAEISLYSYGFINARALSIKLVTSLRLASEQLSQQGHYDYGMRAVITIIKAAGGLKLENINEDEDKIILAAINDSNISKFVAKDIPLFKGITQDLFPDVGIIERDMNTITEVLEEKLEEMKLDRNSLFMEKLIQFYNLIKVRHGIMIIGDSMTAKSTIMDLLQAAMQEEIKQLGYRPGHKSTTSSMMNSEKSFDSEDTDQHIAKHEILKFIINPKAVELHQLYGEKDDTSHDWIDGLLSYRVRMCAESHPENFQWIVFDGPVDPIWIESLNTVLDDNKKLCLSSGEIVKLTSQISILFEVDDLSEASPATVSRAGMIYMERECLSYKSLLRKWISNIPVYFKYEKFNRYFMSLFEAFLPKILKFIFESEKFKMPVACNENALVQSFTRTFEIMLLKDHTRNSMEEEHNTTQAEKAKKDKEEEDKRRAEESAMTPLNKMTSIKSHLKKGEAEEEQKTEVILSAEQIEAQKPLTTEQKTDAFSCLVFALIWGIGGVTTQGGQEVYNEFLKTLVDEVIEQLPAFTAEDRQILKAQTLTINDYYHSKYNYKSQQWENWKDTLPNIIEKAMFLDVNTIIVPTVDTARYGYLVSHLMPRAFSVLLTGVTGTGKTKIIREFMSKCDASQVSTIMTMFSAQSSCNDIQDYIDNRLVKRRKGCFGPEIGKQFFIFIDDFNMCKKLPEGSQPAIEVLREAISFSSWYDRKTCQTKNLEDLVFVSAMGHPGGGRNQISSRLARHFCVFNITEQSEEVLHTIFSTILTIGLMSYVDQIKEKADTITTATIRLFKRVILKLPPTPTKSHYTFNLRDIFNIFRGILNTSQTRLLEIEVLYRLWIHECLRIFSDRMINDDDSNTLKGEIQEVLQQVFDMSWDQVCIHGDPIFCNFINDKSYQECTDMEMAKSTLEAALSDYNMTHATKMKLVLFDFAIQHVTRINRIIANPYGNALLIGVGGTGRQSLTRLAAILQDHTIFQIEFTKSYGIEEWNDDIKQLLLKTGVEEEKHTFILPDTQIKSENYLETINALLSTGEVPNLIGNDEKEMILERMNEKSGLSIKTPLEKWEIFTQTIQMNLHIVLCMSPIGEILRKRLRTFPSLVSCCTIDWITVWPEEALLSVAAAFFKDQRITEDKELEADAIKIWSNFHQSVSKRSVQFKEELKRNNYVTPTNYLNLLQNIALALEYKKSTSGKLREKYIQGVTKLDEAQSVVESTRQEIEALQPKLIAKTEQTMTIMIEIEEEQAKADKSKEEMAVQQKEAAEQAELAAQMKADCEQALAKAIPELDQAIKALKTIKKSEIDEVKMMQNPPYGVRITLEALAITNNMRPTKIQSKEEKGKWVWDYYETGKKMMQNTKFIQQIEAFDRTTLTEQTIAQVQPYIENEKFRPELVCYASRAAEGLCKWVRAMYNFFHINESIKPKKAALETANIELSIRFEDLRLAQEALDKIIQEIELLKENFETVNQKKLKLEEKIAECNRKLDRAESLTDKLGGERTRWSRQVEVLAGGTQNIFGDALLSAGIMSYLGLFNGTYRETIMQKDWLPFITNTCISCTPNFLLKDVLGEPILVQDWIVNGLPDDTTSIENAIIMDKIDAFPLIIDPQKQANRWIRKQNQGERFDVTKLTNNDLLTIIENSVFVGSILLIENVGETFPPILDPLLSKTTEISEGIKMMKIGDTLKQYDDNFRLYVTTALPNPHYPPEISTKMTILNFTISLEGLTEQLRTFVLEKECPKEAEEKKNIVTQASEYSKKLQDQEDKILDILRSASGNILDNEAIVDALTSCKEVSFEVETKLRSAKESEEKIAMIQENYTPVGRHGAILYFTVSDLSNMDHMYQFSLEWFTSIYKKSIEQAPKNKDVNIRCESIIDAFRLFLFQDVCVSLFERDKLIFSFLMCLRLMAGDGKVDQQEMRFLLSGVTGNKVNTNGKPGDLEDKLWNQVCEISTIEKFSSLKQHVIDNIEDWNNSILHQVDMIELTPFDTLSSCLPAPFSDKDEYSSMQRLIFFKIFKQEFMKPAIRSFIEHMQGYEYLQFPLFDLEKSYTDSNSKTPLLFMLTPGSNPQNQLKKFADEDRKVLRYVSLGKGQGEKAAKIITDAAQLGGWVLLQNCHLAISWLPTLESIIENLSDNKGSSGMHHEFRIWLTSLTTPDFPVSILQRAIKMTDEPPKGIKPNLLRIYNQITSSKEEMTFYNSWNKTYQWRKMLFSLSLFHTIVRERRKFGALGWNNYYEFNESDLVITRQQLNLMLNQYTRISFQALNYLSGECNYGGKITDDWDRRTLLWILQDFFNPNVLNEEYRFTKMDAYYAPKDSDYVADYVEYIQSLPDEDHPTIFGLHENATITFARRDIDEIFSRLLLIQPGAGTSGGSKTEILNIIEELQAWLHPQPECELASERYQIQYEQSTNIVLLQELERYRSLINFISKALEEMYNAANGISVITTELEILSSELVSYTVPFSWSERSYLSAKPLLAWSKDLQKRLQFLDDWVQKGPPPIFWISGFFNTQSFLTASLQNYARKYKIPIDKLVFDFEMLGDVQCSTGDIRSVDIEQPTDGCYIYGLFLDGARWNNETELLEEARARELFTPMAVIWLKPEEKKNQQEKLHQESENEIHQYQCPMYRTSLRAGELLTTGHSTNFIMVVKLPSEYPEQHWVKRGTALLAQLDD